MRCTTSILLVVLLSASASAKDNRSPTKTLSLRQRLAVYFAPVRVIKAKGQRLGSLTYGLDRGQKVLRSSLAQLEDGTQIVKTQGVTAVDDRIYREHGVTKVAYRDIPATLTTRIATDGTATHVIRTREEGELTRWITQEKYRPLTRTRLWRRAIESSPATGAVALIALASLAGGLVYGAIPTAAEGMGLAQVVSASASQARTVGGLFGAGLGGFGLLQVVEKTSESYQQEPIQIRPPAE
jgi:hypothetical protein